MWALSDVQKVLGKDALVYTINSYNKNPQEALNYCTLIYHGIAVNITPHTTQYRVHMQRYAEDAASGRATDSEDAAQLKKSAAFFYGTVFCGPRIVCTGARGTICFGKVNTVI